MQRIFLFLATCVGLSSCSSSDSGEASASAEPAPSGAKQWGIIGEGNNPFAFDKKDVEESDGGAITSGKRSMYDKKAQSAYAEANSKTPSYLQKSYQKTSWRGEKDYSTGSYQTSSYGESGKSSSFAGKTSRDSSRVARASNKDYSTGSFQTGSANEAGQAIAKKSNAYTDSRNADGWGMTPTIFSREEHRRLSMGQAKSLLGR